MANVHVAVSVTIDGLVYEMNTHAEPNYNPIGVAAVHLERAAKAVHDVLTGVNDGPEDDEDEL